MRHKVSHGMRGTVVIVCSDVGLVEQTEAAVTPAQMQHAHRSDVHCCAGHVCIWSSPRCQQRSSGRRRPRRFCHAGRITAGPVPVFRQQSRWQSCSGVVRVLPSCCYGHIARSIEDYPARDAVIANRVLHPRRQRCYPAGLVSTGSAARTTSLPRLTPAHLASQFFPVAMRP